MRRSVVLIFCFRRPAGRFFMRRKSSCRLCSGDEAGSESALPLLRKAEIQRSVARFLVFLRLYSFGIKIFFHFLKFGTLFAYIPSDENLFWRWFAMEIKEINSSIVNQLLGRINSADVIGEGFAQLLARNEPDQAVPAQKAESSSRRAEKADSRNNDGNVRENTGADKKSKASREDKNDKTAGPAAEYR